jgi:hypothetical protein
MNNKLQKAINISKKTGDRIIVFDSAKDDNPFVVMNLDDYERLIVSRSGVGDLTEDELLDKINRDIAIWKSENEELPLAKNTNRKERKNNDFYKDEFGDNYDYEDDEYDEEINKKDIIDFDEDEDTYYYEEKEDLNSFGRRIGKSGNIWKIPKNIKKSAEEVK